MDTKIFIDNIEKRNKIYELAAKGKATKNDREWLVTNPYYNENGPQYYHYDVINIVPNKWYDMTINSIDKLKDCFLEMVISIPMGKGEICADFTVLDFYGKEKPCKNITMLGMDNQSDNKNHIRIMSNIGLIGIEYKIMLFNRAANRYMPISSGNSKLLFMKKEILADNSINYYCKSDESGRLPSNTDFEKYGFNITIKGIE